MGKVFSRKRHQSLAERGRRARQKAEFQAEPFPGESWVMVHIPATNKEAEPIQCVTAIRVTPPKVDADTPVPYAIVQFKHTRNAGKVRTLNLPINEVFPSEADAKRSEGKWFVGWIVDNDSRPQEIWGQRSDDTSGAPGKGYVTYLHKDGRSNIYRHGLPDNVFPNEKSARTFAAAELAEAISCLKAEIRDLEHDHKALLDFKKPCPTRAQFKHKEDYVYRSQARARRQALTERRTNRREADAKRRAAKTKEKKRKDAVMARNRKKVGKKVAGGPRFAVVRK